MYDHSRVKSNAKQFVSRNQGASIGALAASYGIYIGGYIAVYIVMMLFAVVFALMGTVGGVISVIITYPLMFGLAFFLGMPLFMGAMAWFQKRIHNDGYPVGGIFAPFRYKYLSNVGTLALRSLYLMLWVIVPMILGGILGTVSISYVSGGSDSVFTVLMVLMYVLTIACMIPMYMKYYAYSVVEYLKMENPNLKPSEAIKLSDRITKGYKGKLFYLDLSFIGWMLLSSLTLGILFIVYVGPYYMAAKAFAYEELKAAALNNGTAKPEEFGISQNF